MTHVVTRPREPFPAAGGALLIHQVPAAQDNLVWIVESVATQEAAVVDGPDTAAVDAYVEREAVHWTEIWNTHTHGDHIGVNLDLARRGRLAGLKRVVGPKQVADQVPGLTHAVDEGDVFEFGGVPIRVLRTEGHIDGHVSFVASDVLFCGDTLFTGGCGFLFDGPPKKMFDSLLRLSQLPGDTRVCCAHEYTEDNLRFAAMVEPDNQALAQRIEGVRVIRAAGESAVPSLLELERATNPFLRPGSPSIRRELAARMPGADLTTHLAVFTATRALKDTKSYRSAPAPVPSSTDPSRTRS